MPQRWYFRPRTCPNTCWPRGAYPYSRYRYVSIPLSSLPSLGPGNVIVMDNASFHSKSRLFFAAQNAGCRVLFLPPYSPELNPLVILCRRKAYRIPLSLHPNASAISDWYALVFQPALAFFGTRNRDRNGQCFLPFQKSGIFCCPKCRMQSLLGKTPPPPCGTLPVPRAKMAAAPDGYAGSPCLSPLQTCGPAILC